MFGLTKTFSILKNVSKFSNCSLNYGVRCYSKFSFKTNDHQSQNRNNQTSQYGGRTSRGDSEGFMDGFGGRGGQRSTRSSYALTDENGNVDWEQENLPVIKKNLLPPTSNSEEALDITNKFLKENEIIVKSDAPLPQILTDLATLSFDQRINKLLKKNFQAPTPIQSIGWPISLSGKDIIGVSKTGSGKTLGFILPAIQHILSQPKQNSHNGPSVLVMAPTRELSVQIEREATPYLERVDLHSVNLFGGGSKSSQIHALRRNPQVVIGTPGRILDLKRDGNLNLKNISYFVLDEADRMLEMGFEEQVEAVFKAIRPDRQVQYWSATWPSRVNAIANKYIINPVKVTVGSTELTINSDISQNFVFVGSDADKPKALLDLLEKIYTERENAKTLIFTMTKSGADRLTDYVNSNSNAKVESIHGDKPQTTRQNIIDDFKASEFDILCATDVASRGLDIKDITDIINFSLPTQVESYVHRIGRTARAGRKGNSHSIVSKTNTNDLDILGDIKSLLEKANKPVPQDILDNLPARYSQKKSDNYNYGRGRGGGNGGYRKSYSSNSSQEGGRKSFGAKY